MGRGLLLAVAVAAAALLAGCDRREEDFYLDNLLPMEKPAAGVEERSDERIAELRREIRRYRAEVERKVEAAQQLGVYHKMLAVAYMRREMYRAAYDSLKEALAWHTNNAVLFYYSGICAAQISKSEAGPEKTLWLERAEAAYKRALELDPDHVEALYGLAILYTFETGRLVEAEGLVRRVLALRARHEQGAFLLANILYRRGRLQEAAALYREIAATAELDSSRAEALANQSTIEKEMRGTP
jgi:tetratricopeptide (TPR) repeat protein